jgi:predicted nucleic acid-binding protein
MSDKAFVDSNVILYLMSEDEAKANQAEAVMRSKVTVSVQVFNEVTSVARKKLGCSWDQIEEFLANIASICFVETLTIEIHQHARFIAERYQLAFYDALIVASAVAAECTTLYTEDMQDGLLIEGSLTLCNPFRKSI